MSFGISADGQVGAVSRHVREGGGWGGSDALADLTRAFVADVLERFPQDAPDAGVRVDVNGHVDASSGNLSITVRGIRLLLDPPDPGDIEPAVV